MELWALVHGFAMLGIVGHFIDKEAPLPQTMIHAIEALLRGYACS